MRWTDFRLGESVDDGKARQRAQERPGNGILKMKSQLEMGSGGKPLESAGGGRGCPFFAGPAHNIAPKSQQIPKGPQPQKGGVDTTKGCPLAPRKGLQRF